MGKGRAKKSAKSWSACKQVIQQWPRPGVIALIHELYRLSEENRNFLHARRWGAEFGYGISDEISGMAGYWREKLPVPEYLANLDQSGVQFHEAGSPSVFGGADIRVCLGRTFLSGQMDWLVRSRRTGLLDSP
jgi:hypothetical protein